MEPKEKIDTRNAWKVFNSNGYLLGDDALVLQMLAEVIETIRALERIYDNGQAQLVVAGMIPTYQAISSIALSRKIPNLPSLCNKG